MDYLSYFERLIIENKVQFECYPTLLKLENRLTLNEIHFDILDQLLLVISNKSTQNSLHLIPINVIKKIENLINFYRIEASK